MQGRQPSRIAVDRAIKMQYGGAEPILFDNVAPRTPSGKIELLSQILGDRYGAMLPGYRPLVSRYPLTLITPASDKRITSTFGGLPDSDATTVLELTPDDGARRGMTDGMRVRVWNDLGKGFV